MLSFGIAAFHPNYETSDMNSEETITMYRPTGPKELELVEESGYTKWPPRLREQPIFYPVTNEQYAREIAVKWNIKDSKVGRYAVQRQEIFCIPVPDSAGGRRAPYRMVDSRRRPGRAEHEHSRENRGHWRIPG